MTERPGPTAGSSEPRLLICDLDGTLLDPDHRLTPRTRATILALRRSGVEVVLASGRIPLAMESVCRELGLDAPQVTMHGAMVTSPLTGQTVAAYPLGPDDVGAHLAFAGETAVPAILCYPDGFRTDRITPEIAGAFVPYGEPLPEVVPDLGALASSEPYKTYLFTSAEGFRRILNAARRRFGSRYTITSGDGRGVELLSPRANKARAAETVAAALGVDMSEVAAVGDGVNDIEILREAGVSAAMGHAPQEVREAATFVVPDNRREGAAVAIARMFPALRVGEPEADAPPGTRHLPVRSRP